MFNWYSGQNVTDAGNVCWTFAKRVFIPTIFSNRSIIVEVHVYIGSHAIIAADVGEGRLVGAGSVVATKVKYHILVTGNPAHL